MTTTTMTRRPPTDTDACGTMLGHSRHRMRDEKPCRPCLDAANVRREDNRESRLTRPADGRPLPSTFGLYAGRDVPHDFAGRDLSLCVECFGWRDDYRHLVAVLAARQWEVFRQ